MTRRSFGLLAAALVWALAFNAAALAQDDTGESLSQMKAPVCMSSDELVAYQTTLSFATVGTLLERCKTSFSDRLDAKSIQAVEDANQQVSLRPGPVMRRINGQAREPFERAFPGRGASRFADVLQGDLKRIMSRARAETLESCQKLIGLWIPKISENIWEETLESFGLTAFKRDVIRRRRAFRDCE